MRLLSFDLSLSNSGWAAFDVKEGKYTVVGFGSISTKKYAKKQTTAFRLNVISNELIRLYEEYKPNQIIKESSFSNINIRATQQIYKVVGVFELTTLKCGYFNFEDLTPGQIKKALTDNGRASKEMVAAAVFDATGITTKNNDESDALAIGLAYIKNNLIEQII